jgi:hypothetical protein
MAERAANHPARERRVALKKRRHVAEMSPEEMRRELLTSEVTGLPNRRAFDEAGVSSAVAMSDVDGLKALNKYGYETGNAVLKAKADALREADPEASNFDSSSRAVPHLHYSATLQPAGLICFDHGIRSLKATFAG